MRRKPADMIPVLSDNMIDILTKNSKSRTIPSFLIQRSNLILFAAKGLSNQEIAALVGLHYNNVGKWRTRFIKAMAELNVIESTEPKHLAKAVYAVLSDKERPGHPMTFTPEQVTKIIKLACCDPKDFGHEISEWTKPLLAKQIVKNEIADCISVTTVGRFLKAG